MTTLAITGIGGFIGMRMAERALALGWQVQGLDISLAAAERAHALGVQVTVGDINDSATVHAALSGADIVFHTAAIVEEDGNREDYERVNVDGTRTVCSIARALGVRQFVQLSSVMVYGFEYPADVAEDGPVDGQGNAYNDTKLASERVALTFNTPDFAVIVIRPGDVYGTGSVPWLLRPIDLLKRSLFVLPNYGNGVINHVHVDNLLDGVFLAIDKAVGGDIFNITDGIATPCHEFFLWHAKMAGKTKVPAVPAWALKAFLTASKPMFSRLGMAPLASAAAIKFLLRRERYSIEKARRVLGYEPAISLDQGMRAIAAERAA